MSVPIPVRRLAALGVVLASCCAGLALRATQPAPATAPTDLDAFMEKVLERRNENWRALHDYVLDERETLRILGPGGVPLHQLRREFTWYAREGYLVRSPVTSNGVSLGTQDRERYEARWLENEKRRERRQKERTDSEIRIGPGPDEPAAPGQDPEVEAGDVFRQGAEPRFISEAYFLKFPFERGNYYLVGREQLDAREVVKVEYYPTRLFGDRSDRKADQPARSRERRQEDETEDEIERSMNKVSLVTLWIDPAEHQIVRFDFDNVDFNFLPGRAIVRVDEARASMAMGRFFDSVWLPRRIDFDLAATLAAGTYRFEYAREFSDYRRAETSVRVRAYVPKEP